MALIDLKPCPFCGGKAKLFVGSVGISAKCMDCHTQTETYMDMSYADCKKGNATEHVIEAWNRRRKLPGVNEWVSIEDRRPEEKMNPITIDYAEVICAVDFGRGAGRDVRCYKFGHGHFWGDGKIMDDEITHWMYLPTLPEVK